MAAKKLHRFELFKVIESFCKLAANVPIKYFYHIRKSRLAVNKPKVFFATKQQQFLHSSAEFFTLLRKSK